MNKIIFAVLLVAAPALAQDYVLETSIVTDWETVQHYGSVEETRRKIDATIAYADSILDDQLGVTIRVTHVEIPISAADDKLPGHTHIDFLLEALFDHRNNDSDHYYADTTLMLSVRNLTRGSSNYAGAAYIGSICSAKSLSVTELYDNGLDGETLAHELVHVLGSKHDGEQPCEDTPSYGYLMAPTVHSGNFHMSQCSINTVQETIDIFGGCLLEDNVVTQVVTPTPSNNTGGGGSMGLFTLLGLLLIIRVRK